MEEIRDTLKLSELEFYQMYFELSNVKTPKSERLTEQEIYLAGLICKRPLSFTITKGKSKTGKSTKYLLGRDMQIKYSNLKIPAIYGILANLIRKGVLVENNNNIELNKGIQQLRIVVKYNLKQKKNFNFRHSFDFNIDGEGN